MTISLTFIEIFFTIDSIQVIPPIDQCGRTLPSVLIVSEGKQFDNIELINMSSITPSRSMLLHNLSDITRECDELDLHTGRIGEEMVFKYLLNQYRDHPNPVIIKWLNQNRETHLPYDILLTKDRKTFYIEVKSTYISIIN
jgi:hypothetical protein